MQPLFFFSSPARGRDLRHSPRAQSPTWANGSFPVARLGTWAREPGSRSRRGPGTALLPGPGPGPGAGLAASLPPPRCPAPSAALRPPGERPASSRRSHWLDTLPFKPLASHQSQEWKERLGAGEGNPWRDSGRRVAAFPQCLVFTLPGSRLTQLTAGERALGVLRSQPSPSFPEEPVQTLRETRRR